LVVLRGRDHRQVGFAAGAREGRREIGFDPIGAFESHDEHMFCHPTVISGDGAGDPQCDAFFTEQSIAAVPAPEGPNLAGLGEVDDVLFIVAGPSRIGLAFGKRSTDTVQAGDKRSVSTELAEYFLPHVAHDLHADDDIGRVGQFDSYECQRTIDRSHAKRDDIHRPSLHGTLEFVPEQRFHFFRMSPMVRRTGVGFSKRADEGTVFDAGSIGRMAAGQERVWMQLRGEPNQSLGLDKLVRQRVPFLIAAIAQDDAVGLAHNGHLADPLLKRDVGAIEG